MCPDDEPTSLTFDTDDALTMEERQGGSPARARGVDVGWRRDRAARAIGAYRESDRAGGPRPPRPRARSCAEQSISELLCDLHHLADELDLDWTGLEERGARYHAEESERHVVEITCEGFQVLDTETDALRADVWGSRRQAQDACDGLNGSSRLARDGGSR
jgi:hypothetical protein